MQRSKVKFTYLPASSTQPQFQGPRPPLFPSTDRPLQHFKLELKLTECVFFLMGCGLNRVTHVLLCRSNSLLPLKLKVSELLVSPPLAPLLPLLPPLSLMSESSLWEGLQWDRCSVCSGGSYRVTQTQLTHSASFLLLLIMLKAILSRDFRGKKVGIK